MYANRQLLQYEVALHLQQLQSVIWNAVVHAKLKSITQDGNEETITAYFASDYVIEFVEENIVTHLEKAFPKIINSFEKFTDMGSGWTLEKYLKLDLNLTTYHPLKASSYMPLLDIICNKHAILNIENVDQKWLVWALLAPKQPRTQNSHRISHYEPFENEIKLEDIKCAVPFTKTPQVERLKNHKITVFTWKTKLFHYISQSKKKKNATICYLFHQYR